MLTIWGRRNAFNVQKVLWLVGELTCRMSTSRPAAISAGWTTRPSAPGTRMAGCR